MNTIRYRRSACLCELNESQLQKKVPIFALSFHVHIPPQSSHILTKTQHLFQFRLSAAMQNIPPPPQNAIESEIDGVHLSKADDVEFYCLNQTKMTRMHIASDTDGASSSQPHDVFSAVQKLDINGEGIDAPVPLLGILQRFTNVTALRICKWPFQNFNAQHISQVLGHFGRTVTTLQLYGFHTNSEVLIFLTSMFPHLETLSLEPLASNGKTFRIQQSDLPLGGAGLRGKLDLGYMGEEHQDFLAFISKPPSVLHSICIRGCNNWGQLQELFKHQGGTIQSVVVWLHEFRKGIFIPL